MQGAWRLTHEGWTRSATPRNGRRAREERVALSAREVDERRHAPRAGVAGAL